MKDWEAWLYGILAIVAYGGVVALFVVALKV